MMADADAAAAAAASGASAAAGTLTTSKTLPVVKKAVVKPPTKLILETALLIATATLKGTDLDVWFNEQTNHGRMEPAQFDDKLVSLARTMSINQDEETKKELDTAVSPFALRVVHQLCVSVEGGREVLDVKKFLKLAKSLADSYLEGISAEDEEVPIVVETPVVQAPAVTAAATKKSSTRAPVVLAPTGDHEIPLEEPAVVSNFCLRDHRGGLCVNRTNIGNSTPFSRMCNISKPDLKRK